jgi:hypothetical protein
MKNDFGSLTIMHAHIFADEHFVQYISAVTHFEIWAFWKRVILSVRHFGR